MVDIIVFGMMAIGLNMVVGYAGLLDLGYVAFYAIGAYTAAWLASPHFAVYGVSLDFGSVAEKGILGVGGIHLSIWIVAHHRRFADGGRRHPHRPADAAAARRLPRRSSRSASARSSPRSRGTATRTGIGFNLTNGPPGINPDRPARLRRLAVAPRRPARQLSDVHVFVRSRGQYVNFVTPHVLDGARAAADHHLLQHPPARLAARPRVDRDPRGRDRRRRDGHPAHAHEDLGLRLGRVLRRRRRRVVRDAQDRRLSRRLLLQHLGAHPVHGHPRRDGQRLGRDRRRGLPRVPQPRGDRQLQRLGQRHTCSCATRASRIRRQSSAAAASTRRSSRSGSTA